MFYFLKPYKAYNSMFIGKETNHFIYRQEISELSLHFK